MKNSRKSARAGRILSGTVSLAMVLGSFMGTGLSAYAEEEKGDDTQSRSSREGGIRMVSQFTADGSRDALLKESQSFPEQFDLRNVDTNGDENPDRCYVTNVKFQGPFGSCWGFAAISAAETSILGSVLENDPDAYKTLNLSEKQLAYFAKSYYDAPGDPQDGEGMHEMGTASDVMNAGGATGLASRTFAAGTGAVSEARDPVFEYRGKNGYTEQRLVNGKYENYGYSADDDWSLDEEYRFVQDYSLKESFLLPSPVGEDDEGEYVYLPEGTAAIKEQLLQKRGVSINYSSDTYSPEQEGDDVDGEFISTENWAHFSWYDKGPTHAVCIVGWDDAYPKENFPAAHQPEGDGAWLVKNSWGTGEESFPNNAGGDWGLLQGQDKAPYEATSDVQTGYFWLSYYDRSIYSPEAMAFEEAADSKNNTLDEYDLMNAPDILTIPGDDQVKMANVFAAETNKRLNAISCMTVNPETTVKYQVYVLYPEENGSPEDGVLMASGEETFRYGGFHKITLDTPVLIQKDQKYSIVISSEEEDGSSSLYIPEGLGKGSSDRGYYVGVVNPGESLAYVDGEWLDMAEDEVKEQVIGSVSWSWADDAYDNFPIKGYCEVLPNLKMTVRKSTGTLYWYDSDSFTANEADYSLRFTGSADQEMGTPEIRWELQEGGDKIVEMTTSADQTTAHFKAVGAGDTRVNISVTGLGLMSMPVHVEQVVPKTVNFTVSNPVFPYTGEAVVPEIEVEANADVTLTEGEDYTVSVTDNVNCGLGYVTVKAAGKCLNPEDPFETKRYFFIVPPKTEIENVTAGGTNIRLQVSDFTDIGVSGYYVFYKAADEEDMQNQPFIGTGTELLLTGLKTNTEYQIMVCGVAVAPEELEMGENAVAPGEFSDPVVVKTLKADYHSEWVNGKWYEADGLQTYPHEGRWMKDSKGKWYQDAFGWYPKNRWQTIDGKEYFFDAKGYAECDAYRNGYYLTKDGSWDGRDAVPGWKDSPMGWYFSLSDGTILKNTWKKINGKWYHFGTNGVMAANCWLKDNGKWYYFGKNGVMVTDWQKIDGKWYYFSGGAMRTGWVFYKNAWYFLKSKGGVLTGWNKLKGTWYYFDKQGRLYTNAYIDQKYFVDENGAWDGVTITGIPVSDVGADGAPSDTAPQDENGSRTLTFHQDGWYVARLEVEVWDKEKQDFVWLYSDSRAKGQKTVLSIDTNKYEISRVGYQIWFFGWDNDYMNIPWANTDYATDFTLSGFGDYPEFTWK